MQSKYTKEKRMLEVHVSIKKEGESTQDNQGSDGAEYVKALQEDLQEDIVRWTNSSRRPAPNIHTPTLTITHTRA